MEPGDRVRNVAHVMRVDSITAEVVTRLTSLGIRTILLKGPSFGAWLYDERGERLYADTDLLVSPAQAAELEAALTDLGFEIAIPRHELDRPVPAMNWLRRAGGAAVDVHRGLTGAGVPHEEQWAILSRDTEWMRVGGADVEILPAPARALHVVLHLAQDGRETRPLRDVERAVERVPDDVWREAAALATRLDAVAAFAGGLRLVDGGPALADRLGLPAARSVEVILREEGAPLVLGLKWLTEMPGGRARLTLIRRKLFPAPHDLVPDPKRRSAGKLVGAYGRHLLRMTRLAPSAWRALRRARRLAAEEAGNPSQDDRGEASK